MLCHEYKCIYIHIPKVAGQSVHYFFADLLGYRCRSYAKLLLKANSNPAIGNHHLKAKEYLNCEEVNEHIFNNYFKFSFVRNPWSRLVSEYKFRNHPRHYDFKTFLFHHLPPPSGWDDNYCHIIPQYDFLYDDDDNLLVDFVGRFESLDQDFAVVCQNLDIPAACLPKINQRPQALKIPKNLRTARKRIRDLLNISQARQLKMNTHGNYKEYYDNESREAVGAIYRKDIEKFGYTFEQ